MDILSIIVLTLFLTLIINITFVKLGLTPIVGYIATGSILAYFLDLSNVNNHSIELIAEFGIVFLMFTIGLEFSIEHFKNSKKEIFLFGGLEVIVVAAIFGFLAHYLFSLDIKTSIIIGSAISLSSTAIVLKSLNENGDIHRPYGKNSVGILIFQDLAVIPILLMITIFTNSKASISELVLNTSVSAIIVIAFLFLIGKYVLPKILYFVVSTKSEEIFISSILFLVLASSLFAHNLGFSYSLGAFIAGMVIAETKYKYQIEADLVPFRDILLGVFFISVGLQVKFSFIFEHFFTIIGLAIIILALKAVIIFALISIFDPAKRAFKTALALAQVGEFSFAIFALAKNNNLLDDFTNSILISVVIVSLIFTSLVIKYVRRFTDFFWTKNDDELNEPIKAANLSNHIVVIGYSKLGQKVVKLLNKNRLNYIAIEHDKDHVIEGKNRGDLVIFANAASKHILNSVNIKEASCVIITIDNDEKVHLICELIRDINKDVPIILKISHKVQIEDLKDLKINYFINENRIIAQKLVDRAITCPIKH